MEVFCIRRIGLPTYVVSAPYAKELNAELDQLLSGIGSASRDPEILAAIDDFNGSSYIHWNIDVCSFGYSKKSKRF